jgi:class 3 adenylate cyclase/tetratricopeptide (TPR) repeat protein
MKCPDCSFENAADSKFCENCGQPFEFLCPNCSKPTSPTGKFCKNCGFKLQGAAVTARAAAVTRTDDLDALHKAAPQTVAKKILAERERMEGERKLVTALFTDIVGSTMLAERMDPEDWREIVSEAHRRVSDAVYSCEGMILQLLGDGVLAFFGAPLAHEDDAERAIRASLGILASIQKYAQELQTKKLVENFQMRVGLNTGLVVVGNIGSDLHMEYAAIGDTVNLASRMQSAAEPNTILISQNTHRLASSLFEFEDRGKITVKGKTEAIQVYRVLGERKGAVRRRGIAGLMSPMVGRGRELSQLMQCIADAQAGRGSIVAIIGEAGLGKSRLVAEWRKATLAIDHALRWIEGRCLSYGASTPYHLGTDILRAIIGAPTGASEEETGGALWKLTESLFGAEMKEVYPFLGHLLGVTLEEDMRAPFNYLDGSALQAKYIAAFKRLLQKLAQSAPLVIVCEDLHWADPSSVELGLQILPVAMQVPLIVVFVTREERESAGWKMITQAHSSPGVGMIELHLAALSEQDSKQLVNNLLDVEAVLESLLQLILRKAEGNPFFVEEVIRMLIDRGGIERQAGKPVVTREIQSIEIPDTIQGVLSARIDRLLEDAKRVLQIASVIGRTFQIKVLEQVLEQPEINLSAILPQLENAQLVRHLVEEEPAYMFKHALTQETAYKSLLRPKRREIHLRVAEIYERTYTDRLDEYAALLARHFEFAEEHSKALEYLMRAAEWARRAAAHREEIEFLARAIALAQQTSHPELIADLHARRGKAFASITMWKQARQELELALGALPPAEDERRVQVLLDLADATEWLWDSSQARQYINQALVIAEKTGNDNLLACVMSTLAFSQVSDAQTQEGLERYEHAFARATDHHAPYLIVGKEFSGLALYWVGRYNDAITRNREALRLAREVSNTVTIVRALTNLGMAQMGLGLYAEAINSLNEARRFGQEHNVLAWLARATSTLGGLYLDLGDYARAESIANEARDLSSAASFTHAIASTNIDLIFNFVRSGQVGRVGDLVDKVVAAIGTTHGSHRWLWEMRLIQARAELAVARGDWDTARGIVEEALARSRATGRLKYQSLGLVTRAKILSQQNLKREAIQDLQTAIQLARTLDDPLLFLKAATPLIAEGGDDVLIEQARAAAKRIASALPDNESRRRFESSGLIGSLINPSVGSL